jgi:hypothetical protein
LPATPAVPVFPAFPFAPFVPVAFPDSNVIPETLRCPPSTRKSWVVEPPLQATPKPPEVMFTVSVEGIVMEVEKGTLAHVIAYWTVPPPAIAAARAASVQLVMVVAPVASRSALFDRDDADPTVRTNEKAITMNAATTERTRTFLIRCLRVLMARNQFVTARTPTS